MSYINPWTGRRVWRPAWVDEVRSREDDALMVGWLVDNGRADEAAYAVEKPWKYADELAAARAES